MSVPARGAKRVVRGAATAAVRSRDGAGAARDRLRSGVFGPTSRVGRSTTQKKDERRDEERGNAVRCLRRVTKLTVHTFYALAFVENFTLKELAASYPEAKRSLHHLVYPAAAGGTVFMYSFGAIVFHNVGQQGREAELLRMRAAGLAARDAAVINEEFSVQEVAGERADVQGGVLVVDQVTPERAAMVAHTMAQSAAMEYYERIVDQMFADTDRFALRLEKAGNMSVFTGPLHRFIGAAISTRSEVLSVLHLLDKPDVVWDDAGAERIYEELRAEFDLVDRYTALELKLRSVQDALSLVVDVARDQRLVLLEASIVALIVLEIVLSFFPH
jgi:uncharacterized Rmd1/YagE family protein